MDFSSINPALLIASLMVSSTPILLAAIGEAVVEKSGVLNPLTFYCHLPIRII